MRFMTKMESLMSEGKGEEVCAMFHEDLEVEIADHSGESLNEHERAERRSSASSPRRRSPDCSWCRIP